MHSPENDPVSLTSTEEMDLLEAMMRTAPALRSIYDENLRHNFGEVLSHLIMADFTRWFVDWVTKKQETERARKLLHLLDERFASSSGPVRDLIGASFVENLWQADDKYGEVKSMLEAEAPSLSRQLKVSE